MSCFSSVSFYNYTTSKVLQLLKSFLLVLFFFLKRGKKHFKIIYVTVEKENKKRKDSSSGALFLSWYDRPAALNGHCLWLFSRIKTAKIVIRGPSHLPVVWWQLLLSFSTHRSCYIAIFFLYHQHNSEIDKILIDVLKKKKEEESTKFLFSNCIWNFCSQSDFVSHFQIPYRHLSLIRLLPPSWYTAGLNVISSKNIARRYFVRWSSRRNLTTVRPLLGDIWKHLTRHSILSVLTPNPLDRWSRHMEFSV